MGDPKKYISLKPPTNAGPSRLPIRKQGKSPEVKKTKPKKTKATIRNSAATKSKLIVGFVTGLRSDNTVNIRINGDRFRGVPTMDTYDPRAVGDKVSIIKHGSQYIVMGKVSSDDLDVTPTICPKDYGQWTWGVNKGLSDRRMFIEYEVYGWRVGRKSEQFPVSDTDYFVRLGIGYWDGANNVMTGPAAPPKQ